MTLLLLFLILGLLVGAFGLLPAETESRAVKLGFPALVVLIGSMGAKIGLNEDLLNNFFLLGWQGFVLALSAVAGSLACVWFLERHILNSQGCADFQNQTDEDFKGVPQKVSYALTGVILGSLFLGVGAGRWLLTSQSGDLLNTLTNWALYLALWAVGLDLGRSKETLAKVVSMGWKVLLAPLGVALGSIIGSILGGIILSLPLNESAAVGAGFGWYSLSGVLLSQIYSVQLGTVAFLSNLFRELIAVVTIPFLARRLGPLATVAPAGATAMDTTLPLIAASADSYTAFVGFISGFCLSGLVPLLVPLVVKL